MNRSFLRPFGFVLVLGGVFGWLISLVGLYVILSNVPTINDSVTRSLTVLDTSIRSATDGLDIIQSSLEQTRTDLGLMQTTLDDTANMLADMQGMSQDTAKLIGTDFVDVLNNAQASLLSASKSAKLVDDTLGVITSLPLLRERYQPDVPLNVALGNVSKSLDDLPQSFSQISASMSSASTNLSDIGAGLNRLKESLGGIDENIQKAQAVVGDYQTITTNLQHTIGRLRDGLSGWLRLLTGTVTALLLWMVIASSGLFVQGYDYLSRRRMIE